MAMAKAQILVVGILINPHLCMPSSWGIRRCILELTETTNDVGMFLPLLPISALLHLHFLRKLHRGHPFFQTVFGAEFNIRKVLMKTNRLRATTGYELQPRRGFLVHDQRNSQQTSEASHPKRPERLAFNRCGPRAFPQQA